MSYRIYMNLAKSGYVKWVANPSHQNDFARLLDLEGYIERTIVSYVTGRGGFEAEN